VQESYAFGPDPEYDAAQALASGRPPPSGDDRTSGDDTGKRRKRDRFRRTKKDPKEKKGKRLCEIM
jgi:hypothetical protein